MDKYLYIFLHIPKTAGTTFNFHALKNLPEEEGIDLDRIDPALNKNIYRRINFNKTNIKKYADRAIKKIPKKDRKNVRLIYDSHFAYYGIHKHFLREPRYFTFIRNPITRTISTFNYLSTLYYLEDGKGKDKKLYQTLLLVKGRYPSFEEWYSDKFDKYNWTMLTMPTYRILQSIGMLEKGKISMRSVKKMFNKLYFVGTTQSFDDDVLFLYDALGFNKFFASQNTSIKYFEPDDIDNYKRMMLKKNKPSFEIYEMAKEFNSDFKRKHKEYKNVVEQMKDKRKIMMPITQVVYDPRGTLGLASSTLRKKVPYYSETLNYIKHNVLK